MEWNLIKAAAAGFLISIGCKVAIMEGSFLGAILFSLALLCIIHYKLPLFTGKVGYRTPVSILVFVLVFNMLGAFFGSLLFDAQLSAVDLYQRCNAPWYKVLCNGIGCGVLMFLAVDYGKRNPLIVIMAITTFILCGFEHCIADMAYIATKADTYWAFLLLVIAGNAIGGKLTYYLTGAHNDRARIAAPAEAAPGYGQGTAGREARCRTDDTQGGHIAVHDVVVEDAGAEVQSAADKESGRLCESGGKGKTESSAADRKCWHNFLATLRRIS